MALTPSAMKSDTKMIQNSQGDLSVVWPIDAGEMQRVRAGGAHLWSQHPDLRGVPHANDEDNTKKMNK